MTPGEWSCCLAAPERSAHSDRTGYVRPPLIDSAVAPGTAAAHHGATDRNGFDVIALAMSGDLAASTPVAADEVAAQYSRRRHLVRVRIDRAAALAEPAEDRAADGDIGQRGGGADVEGCDE